MKIFNLVFLFSLTIGCTTTEKEKTDSPDTDSLAIIDAVPQDYVLKVDTSLIDAFNNDEQEWIEPEGFIKTLTYFSKLDTTLFINEETSIHVSFQNVIELDTIDPGDFRKLLISYQNDTTEFLELGGWVSNYGHGGPSSTYFLLTDIGFKNKVLILTGYPYASDPQLLTIIGFDDVGSKVLFNKQYDIKDIQDDYLLVTDPMDRYSRIMVLEDSLFIYQASGEIED